MPEMVQIQLDNYIVSVSFPPRPSTTDRFCPLPYLCWNCLCWLGRLVKYTLCKYWQGSQYVAQAGLEFLGSGYPPDSASEYLELEPGAALPFFLLEEFLFSNPVDIFTIYFTWSFLHLTLHLSILKYFFPLSPFQFILLNSSPVSFGHFRCGGSSVSFSLFSTLFALEEFYTHCIKCNLHCNSV